MLIFIFENKRKSLVACLKIQGSCKTEWPKITGTAVQMTYLFKFGIYIIVYNFQPVHELSIGQQVAVTRQMLRKFEFCRVTADVLAQLIALC